MPFIRLPSWTTTPPSQLPEETGARDLCYLWDVMCNPDEDRAATRDLAYAASVLADALRGAPPEFPMTADEALRLSDAPNWAAYAGGADESAKMAGFVAGIKLLWINARSQHEETRESASVGGAARMIDGAFRQRRRRGGSTHNHRRTWPRYRPVPHLWGAMHIWVDDGRDPETLCAAAKLCELLSTAEWLRRWGETFVVKGADAPVLDPETTWKVPPEVAATWPPPIELPWDDPDAWDLRRN